MLAGIPKVSEYRKIRSLAVLTTVGWFFGAMLAFFTVEPAWANNLKIVVEHYPESKTLVIISGPEKIVPPSQTAYTIKIESESNGLIGDGAVALALPEIVQVDYANISMHVLPRGDGDWLPFKWRDKPGTIDQLSRWAVIAALTWLSPATGPLMDLAVALGGDYSEFVGFNVDLNHYDIVVVRWTFPFTRIEADVGRSVRIRIPVKFGKHTLVTPSVALAFRYSSKKDIWQLKPDHTLDVWPYVTHKLGSELLAVGSTKDLVNTVQQALKKKGFNPGPIDGILGIKTSEALNSFQNSENINSTGRLNTETLLRLGIDTI